MREDSKRRREARARCSRAPPRDPPARQGSRDPSPDRGRIAQPSTVKASACVRDPDRGSPGPATAKPTRYERSHARNARRGTGDRSRGDGLQSDPEGDLVRWRHSGPPQLRLYEPVGVHTRGPTAARTLRTRSPRKDSDARLSQSSSDDHYHGVEEPRKARVRSPTACAGHEISVAFAHDPLRSRHPSTSGGRRPEDRAHA